MSVWVCTQMSVRVCIHTHSLMLKCVHTHTRTHARTQTLASMLDMGYIYIYTRMSVCVYTYTLTHSWVNQACLWELRDRTHLVLLLLPLLLLLLLLLSVWGLLAERVKKETCRVRISRIVLLLSSLAHLGQLCQCAWWSSSVLFEEFVDCHLCLRT